jgi:hypothetical protein
MINLTTSPPAGNDSVLASFLEAPSEAEGPRKSRQRAAQENARQSNESNALIFASGKIVGRACVPPPFFAVKGDFHT